MPELERSFEAANIGGTGKGRDRKEKGKGTAASRVNQEIEEETPPFKRALGGRLVADITEKPSIKSTPSTPVRHYLNPAKHDD